MRPEDFAAFKRELVTAGTVVGRRVSTDTAEAYFHALDDLSFDALFSALRRFTRTAERTEVLPTPVELRRRATMRVATRAAPAPAVPAAERPVRREDMARILREVAPQATSVFARALRAVAGRIEEAQRAALPEPDAPGWWNREP